MNIIEMHYDFRQKLNKADSQMFRNLRSPEIDWYLNEAQLLFIRGIMDPRQRYMLEISPRGIDDLNTIIKRSDEVTPLSHEQDTDRYYFVIDDEISDYLYFIAGECRIHREDCNGSSRIARVFEKRHVDTHERDEFYRSSYEWCQVNMQIEVNTFEVSGQNVDKKVMVLFTDGDRLTEGSFVIDGVYIDYLKKPIPMFFGGYDSLDGNYTVASPTQNCELPDHVHTDVVDLAVLLASGSLQSPDYQLKMQKIQMINN